MYINLRTELFRPLWTHQRSTEEMRPNLIAMKNIFSKARFKPGPKVHVHVHNAKTDLYNLRVHVGQNLKIVSMLEIVCLYLTVMYTKFEAYWTSVSEYKWIGRIHTPTLLG